MNPWITANTSLCEPFPENIGNPSPPVGPTDRLENTDTIGKLSRIASSVDLNLNSTIGREPTKSNHSIFYRKKKLKNYGTSNRQSRLGSHPQFDKESIRTFFHRIQ